MTDFGRPYEHRLPRFEELIRFEKAPNFIYLIEDVVIKKVPFANVITINTARESPYHKPSFDPESPIIVEQQIHEVTLHYADLRMPPKEEDDGYTVAYVCITPNVERIFGKPFNIVLDSAKRYESWYYQERDWRYRLVANLRKAREMTLWQRVVFLFTKRGPGLCTKKINWKESWKKLLRLST